MTRSLKLASELCVSRRDLLRLWAAGALAGPVSGWLPALADQTAGNSDRKRSCILLWMAGGPSQIDTFDPKPGHANGGPVKAIETAVPGVHISEYLPQVAQRMKDMVLVRSMQSKEQDHGRATHLMHTGRPPQGPIRYPSLGSALSKELGDDSAELPNFVSIAPERFRSAAAFGPGFLGPRYAPLVVGEDVSYTRANADYAKDMTVKNLARPEKIAGDQFDARMRLLDGLEQEFHARRPSPTAESHRTAYDRAVRLMRSNAKGAFDVDSEPKELLDAYGRNPFGHGCLLARRLVERGVPFVEVALKEVPDGDDWDTHSKNFPATKKLCGVLDPAWATLIADLRDKGLLESTLIVWMGEFGRTPKINRSQGRDHHSASWSTVLSGGGVQGGSVVGRTSADGMTVEDRPVAVNDLLATICLALGVDPMTQNDSNVGRPIRLVDPEAQPIREVLA